MPSPIDVPCMHVATDQERARDRDYLACYAKAGQPCSWCPRYDGQTNPLFHSERIETATEMVADDNSNAPSEAQFNAAVEAAGENLF